MKKALFAACVFAVVISSLCGCVPLIVGGALGAAGGYAISKDTVQGDTDKDYDSLWNAAQDVLNTRGKIKKEDFSRGYIEGVTQDSSLVWVRMTRLTKTASRVRVSARRYHLPNLNLAQDIFVRIIEEVK